MVARLAASDEPLGCERAPAGSQLDPLEPALRRLLVEGAKIKARRVTEILRDEYGRAGLVDVVKRRLRRLRPPRVRPARPHRLQAGAGDAARRG